MIRYITTILFIWLCNSVLAEDKRYGPFVYFDEVPKALFLLGEIEVGSSSEFLRALRRHEISILVLHSQGGVVSESLLIGEIVSKNRLATFIPKGTTLRDYVLDGKWREGEPFKAQCLSACSLVFFAGWPRAAQGILGVHQISLSDDPEFLSSSLVREIQNSLADIISQLNSYPLVPDFVLERMLSTEEMYIFNEQEADAASTNGLALLGIIPTNFDVEPYTLRHINECLVNIQNIIDGYPPILTDDRTHSDSFVMEFSPRCYPEEVLQAEAVLKKYKKRFEVEFPSNHYAKAHFEYLEAATKEARSFLQKSVKK